MASVFSSKVSEGWVTRHAHRLGGVVLAIFRDGKFAGWHVVQAPVR